MIKDGLALLVVVGLIALIVIGIIITLPAAHVIPDCPEVMGQAGYSSLVFLYEDTGKTCLVRIATYADGSERWIELAKE